MSGSDKATGTLREVTRDVMRTDPFFWSWGFLNYFGGILRRVTLRSLRGRLSCAGPRLSLCGQGREPASPSSPDSTQLVPPHGLKALTHPCHPPKTCFGSRRWLVFSMSEEVQPCRGAGGRSVTTDAGGMGPAGTCPFRRQRRAGAGVLCPLRRRSGKLWNKNFLPGDTWKFRWWRRPPEVSLRGVSGLSVGAGRRGKPSWSPEEEVVREGQAGCHTFKLFGNISYFWKPGSKERR